MPINVSNMSFNAIRENFRIYGNRQTLIGYHENCLKSQYSDNEAGNKKLNIASHYPFIQHDNVNSIQLKQ